MTDTPSDDLPDPPEITDEVIDDCLGPAVLEIVQASIAVGRQPDQAIDDIHRICDKLQEQLHRDRMAALAAGGDLPD